ncbi:hypothetical protein [Actinopolyspora saharensis]|uniref:Uncharacterized protein n=1 Tax=Actinopolyspora saharensis TaxID=995062 RepID=A0A1H0YJI4_9ACTN|nr:hypothetical protein [Actinopolyspora saharensis]SDQ15076.1 hypothetical protein SAMN04489718_0488 [Actinopolyspora saharensis]
MAEATPSTLSSCDYNILDVMSGNFPVVLNHAVNGGYLRPDALNPDDHYHEARAHGQLDDNTKNNNGHLWYLTPGIFIERLQRMTYYIESACSHQPAADDPNTDKRRRITITTENPTHHGVAVGTFDQVPNHYQSDEEGAKGRYNQLWIVTPTCCGALTFIPVLHLDVIWGTKGNSPHIGECPRPVENVGGNPIGSGISRWIPSRPQQLVASS